MALFALAAIAIRAEVKVGDSFPPLRSAGVDALSAAIPETTQGHVLLVDFWASWCAPCKASFPAMAKLHEEFAARGLVIAAVSVDEKPAAAAAFWKRMAPPFAGLHDNRQKLVAAVGPAVMPTSYVVGRDGRVRFVQQGFQGAATEKELRRQIEAALAESGRTTRNP